MNNLLIVYETYANGLFANISYYLIMLGLSFIGLHFTASNLIYGIDADSSSVISLGVAGVMLKSEGGKYEIGISVKEGEETSITDRTGNFIEWFRGFVDGEGSFMIAKNKSLFTFSFAIQLHKDDRAVLHYIQGNLGLGKVTVSENLVKFLIVNQKEVAKLIEIFTANPLNTTKVLNFLGFKKAFELYTSSTSKSESTIREIEIIRSGLNNKRSSFQKPEGHKLHITPSWLLGFIEGEGTFFVQRKSFRLEFSLGQAEIDLDLMEEIKNFFDSFPGVVNGRYKGNLVVNLYNYPGKNLKHKSMVKLFIVNYAFICDHFIPLFNSLVWHSKKELDYLDWLSISKLRDMGLQYTEEGLKLMQLILSQMNSYRLSTSSSPRVDREVLRLNVDKLLNGPSNLEVKKDGRIFIKSLNRHAYNPKSQIVQLCEAGSGIVLQSFESTSACARLLGIPQSTASKRLNNEIPFLFEDKTVYLKREEVLVDVAELD